MKKSFTFFAISALFLMLLFPVSVKAECTNALNLDISSDRVIPSSCPTGAPSELYWNHNYYGVGEDDYFWDWKNSIGELYYKITLNRATTCTFSISLANSNNAWMNIYSAGTGNDQCVVGGETYHKLSYHDLNGHNNSQSFNTETVSSVDLSEGTYIISIYGKEWTSMRSISITASDSVFCEPACTKHTVTLTAGANGSVSGGGEQCDGSVTVTATPNSGYRFVNWTNTSTSAEVSTDAEYTFDLSEDISLTANFAVEICSNTMVLQCEDYVDYNTKPSGSNDNKPGNLKSKNYTGYGNPIGGYYADFDNSNGEMWIPVTLPAGTFTFTVRYVKGGNNMWFNLYDVSNNSKIANSKQLSQKGDSWDSDVSNSYTLTSGDYVIGIYGNDNYTGLDQITITATSNVFCPYAITMEKSGDESAAAPTASPANAAMAGTEVTITAGEASANHYFSGWTVSPENAVTFANPANATTTFSMPASDVTITANYGAVVSSEFTYTTSGSGSITCATASGSSVESGTPISMTAEPSTDYVFTGWTATAGTFSNAATLTTTFTMPAEAATVTATFAQVDNKIITGTSATVIESNGDATLTVTSVSDFDAFNHNVLKFAYSDMDGKYKGQKVAKDAGYSSASSAGATGFGFYYKTEKADDNVAFCFEVSSGQQVKWELQATNNVWKYYYFAHPEAAGWAHSGIFIYMNGDDGDNHTTYKDGGVFYMSEIAATTITSKPDIANYHYTNNRGGAMQVNEYGTLCLPMDGTISGATLYSVAGKETGDINYLVLEDKGTTVVAGKPYITQSTATSYTVTMSGVHSDLQDGNGLVGTYTEIENLTPYDDTHHNYFLYANAFKKAGTGVTVGAYRAYLNWDAVSAAPAPAPSARRIRMVIEGTNSATGLEDLINDQLPVTTKVLIDGQLFIIREGKRYTLTGARAQ